MYRLPRKTACLYAPMAWILLFLGGFAIAGDLVQQRQVFHEARNALAEGDTHTFKSLLPGLAEYPLYGYLIYDDLKSRLNAASDSEIQAFLSRYADLPVSGLLRNTWLKHLAEEERWADFLANYRETQSTALRCLHVQSLFAANEVPNDEELRSLWLVGKDQPQECEDLFGVWHSRGGLTNAALWQRVVLAFEAGNVDLAERISLWLPAVDRSWVQIWARAHQNPQTGWNDPALSADTPRAREVLRHAILRLARISVSAAADRWEGLKGRYVFSASERWETERGIALRAALDRHPRAVEWLSRLTASDAEVRRARVRAALWWENWAAVLRGVYDLKPWERTADRWRYWEARALEETGDPARAREIYRDLASHRSYHGFLAADRIGQSYAFHYQPLNATEESIARFAARPAVVRAHELLLTEYLAEGRREWAAAITGIGQTELAAAAQLAARWKWSDRVITTLGGHSPEDDDLVLRFPLEYRDQVVARSAAFGVSPAVVYGVIRQESVFMADARSSVGALGLMQLMPSTAAQVAKGLRVSFAGTSDLLDPEENIHLGSAFLADLVKRQGSVALAAAAYNAGPGRVKQWRPPSRMAADVWVESIPFDETRRYVRSVLTYATIYAWRLQQSTGRLADGMPAVEP